MHPAYSVILFTTASGAGYGLLAWLGVFALGGALAPDDLASGSPRSASAVGADRRGPVEFDPPSRPAGARARRAFSQWRSSWLSREGVAAVATFLPLGLFAIGWVFFNDVGGIFRLDGGGERASGPADGRRAPR